MKRLLGYLGRRLGRITAGAGAAVNGLSAEQALSVLRQAYADIHDMILIYSLDGELVYGNERAFKTIELDGVDQHPLFRADLRVFDLAGNRIEQRDWPIFRAIRGEQIVDLDIVVHMPHFAPERVIRHARISATQSTFNGLSRDPMILVNIRDTTSFRMTEQRISESEAQVRHEGALLSSIMDALPIAVITTDREANLLRHNAACCDQARQLKLGQDGWSDAIPPTYWSETGEPLKREDWPLTRALLDGITTVRQRIDVPAAAGGVRNLSISAAPVRDATGAIIASVIASEDVTDLVSAHRALNERETRLRLLVDSAHDHAVFMLDRDGCVATWSAAASRLKQYRAEDVIGVPWSAFFSDDDIAAGLPARLLATARTAGCAYHQGWLRRQDGSLFWVDGVVSAIIENAEVVGFVEVARDLTEQRRSQAELKLRDDALLAVSQGILIVDARAPDQPIVLASGAFEALTGYSTNEVIGRNCRFLQGPDTAREDIAKIRAALAAGESCSVEILNSRKDGSTFWNALSISPVRDATGAIEKFIGVMADVTKRRDLEERLRQSLKMDALGRMAGGIAHDFNNILTIINGNVEELRDDCEAGTILCERLDLIAKAGLRAELMTNQLLTFSKRSLVTLHGIDLVEVIANMRALLHSLTGDNITLDVRLQDGLWLVRADRSQIEQVLLNIVINARDASFDGGAITLEIVNAPARLRGHGDAARGDAAKGDAVVIRLTDHGIGMAADTRARAFEPFFTTKGEAGSGLGLATVFGIVNQTGGTIALKSDLGVGTTIEIALPVALASTVGSTVIQPSASVEQGLVALVAEDDDDVRAIIQRALERAHVGVFAFANGLDAINFIRASDRRIDILITDIIMPVIGGVSLFKAANAIYPELRTLFVTGFNDVDIPLDPERVHTLSKPFTGKKLVDALNLLMTKAPLHTEHASVDE